ncbi:MAG: malonic semialdehyde reductase, partial [Alphaproteobacteria bacterium]|nr:malonic semialdehyde reductase [Alphaproteobacteria bacterium]
ERLRPHLAAGNVEQSMTAPVTVIVAYDLRFSDQFEKLSPGRPEVRGWFEGKDELILETAFRSGSLQGAYLMVAARALGLDCGPMSGFDKAGVDAEFFADSPLRSNFLCNLGHGDPAALPPRKPRLPFAEAAEIL